MDLLLTADLGNTRVKLVAWDARTANLVARAAFDTAAGAGGACMAFVREHRGLRGGALSSVASAAVEVEVLDALRAALGEHVVAAPDPGLVLDVREPARVGRDRVYAARGALEHPRYGSDGTIVVDAGTALTVDALDDGARTFRGGSIAPGPVLLARALAEHTARLPRVEPRPGVPALGCDTEAALQSGVVVGFRGAARELVACVAVEAGFRAPRVIVTGGARALLAPASTFAAPPCAGVVEDEDLVHRGLLAALRAAGTT